MTSLFWWVAGVGLLLLLAAAGLLVWLNFSEQVWVPLSTALLIGVLTFAITFVSTLRSAEEETTFTISLAEDTRKNLPVFVFPDPAHSTVISERASELGMAAISVFPPGTSVPEPAIPESDVTTFNLELLQYVMIRTIRDRQRIGWGIATVLTPEGNVTRAGVNRPPTLTNPTSLQGDRILNILESNRFAPTLVERFSWEHIRLTLPEVRH